MTYTRPKPVVNGSSAKCNANKLWNRITDSRSSGRDIEYQRITRPSYIDGTLAANVPCVGIEWKRNTQSACPSANFHVNLSRWNRIQHSSIMIQAAVYGISPPKFPGHCSLAALPLETDRNHFFSYGRNRNRNRYWSCTPVLKFNTSISAERVKLYVNWLVHHPSCRHLPRHTALIQSSFWPTKCRH